MKEKNLFEAIMATIMGHKYYANIINTKGTKKCEITSFIHPTREAAEQHKREIESTSSFLYVETITFRSRKIYA